MAPSSSIPGSATAAVLADLRSRGDRAKSVQMAAYHKVARVYLGVANPAIDSVVRGVRAEQPEAAWVSIAGELWDTDIHEARIGAAKLVDRNRFHSVDGEVWALIRRWVEDFDAWAVADHATIAGQKRLVNDHLRLEEVEAWTSHPHMWVRRAALVITLPFARQANPGPDVTAVRERVLTWAAGYVADPDWFIQKAVAWWLRDLSRRDPDATRAFLAEHGPAMSRFARRGAARHLA
jgi:3-methyladenine DNA glycosylase AlkD